jgi:hypothetical protein
MKMEYKTCLQMIKENGGWAFRNFNETIFNTFTREQKEHLLRLYYKTIFLALKNGIMFDDDFTIYDYICEIILHTSFLYTNNETKTYKDQLINIAKEKYGYITY